VTDKAQDKPAAKFSKDSKLTVWLVNKLNPFWRINQHFFIIAIPCTGIFLTLRGFDSAFPQSGAVMVMLAILIVYLKSRIDTLCEYAKDVIQEQDQLIQNSISDSSKGKHILALLAHKKRQISKILSKNIRELRGL